MPAGTQAFKVGTTNTDLHGPKLESTTDRYEHETPPARSRHHTTELYNIYYYIYYIYLLYYIILYLQNMGVLSVTLPNLSGNKRRGNIIIIIIYLLDYVII